MTEQAHHISGLKHANAFQRRPHISIHGLPLSPVPIHSNRHSIASHLRTATTTSPQDKQAFSSEVERQSIMESFKVPNRSVQQAYVTDEDDSGNEIPFPTSQQEQKVDGRLQFSFHRPVEQASGESFVSSQTSSSLLPMKPAVSVRKRKIQHDVSDSDNAGPNLQPSSEDDLPLAMRPQTYVMKKSKAQNFPSAPKAAVGQVEQNQFPARTTTSLRSSGKINRLSAGSSDQSPIMMTYISPSVEANSRRTKQPIHTTNPVGYPKPDGDTKYRTGRAAKLKAAARLGEYFQADAGSYDEETSPQVKELE